MSLVTEWQPTEKEAPAEFDIDYATIKVQAVKNPESDEIQVRVAHEMDTDHIEGMFEEWQRDSSNVDELTESFESIYPLLKNMLSRDMHPNDRASVRAVIAKLEENPGLIRCP